MVFGQRSRGEPGDRPSELRGFVSAAVAIAAAGRATMTVPITGALILIIGVLFFFLSSELLYASMIIAIPFSATAVANVGWGGGEKGVAAWLFLGALWVFKRTISGAPPWRAPGWFWSRRARYGLLAFLGAVVASLCVPLLLNGTSWVPDPLSSEIIPLRFGLYNVTQTAYLAFGVLLAVFAAAENWSSARLFSTLKLYVGSCAFAAAWGLFELWCDITGHTYPAYIFNTNAGESALGYLEVFKLAEGNLGRISSVALEPSVLAQELLLAFVILLICLGLHWPLLGKRWDYAALALIVATLVASTSSTAYIGILAALVVAAVALFQAGKPWKLYFVLAGVAVAMGVLVVAMMPFVEQVAAVVVLNKFDEVGSGLERLHSIGLAAQDFLRYPLLGAGWHTVPCWDLLFLILANTGLIGLIAFASFLFPVVRGLWVSAGRRNSAAVVLLSAVTLMVILAEAAGLTYAAGYDWLVFGLGAGAVIVARRESALDAGGRVDASVRRVARATPAEGNC